MFFRLCLTNICEVILLVDVSVTSVAEYDRLCREFDEAHEVEYDEFVRAMNEKGIDVCAADGCPCNMATVEYGDVSCVVFRVRGLQGNMWCCGRIRFRGGVGFDLSITDKVEGSKVLDVCVGKPRQKLCFFGGGLCVSDFDRGVFHNGCVVYLSDKSGGFGSVWYCCKIRFQGSSMSIGDKVRSQHLIELKGGDT